MRSHRLSRSFGWMRGLGMMLALVLFACSGEQYEKPETTDEAAPEAAPPAAPEPAVEPEPEPVEEPAAEPEPASEPEVEATPAAEPAPEAEPAAAGAPADMTLVGVVQAGRSPAALIEYRGSQEMFRTGDSVFGQGTVESVRDDSVVIATESGKMTLGLPAPEAEAPPPTPEPAVVASAPPPGEAPPPPVRESIPRSEAQAAMGRFASLLREAGAEKAEVSGGKGVRLTEVSSDGFLARLGLKSGDVLQEIGGVAVEDPESLPDVSGAAQGQQITVNVVRDEIGLTFSRPLR